MAVLLCADPGQAGADIVHHYVYRVVHATYGDIGTYTNTVDTAGDVTTVKTTSHFVVKMLGITIHTEDAQRTERWKDNRLVFFHGVTDKNGKPTEIKGEARGDSFVISTPAGVFVAPATVHPANPLGSASLKTNAMMHVDTGKVEPVKVSGGGQTTIELDGKTITAREYQVGTRYRVWIDEHDVPVKFIVNDDSGQVTFLLQR